jgi:hypothetical protein
LLEGRADFYGAKKVTKTMYSNADSFNSAFMGLVPVLTAPVYASPFVILPLLKKCFFA